MWYFTQNNSRQGPVSPQEIQSLISQGIITSTTLVWKEGMSDWVLITKTEFKDQFSNNTPPPIPRNSSDLTPQKLEPVRLMKDAFAYAGGVYIPLIAISVFFVLFNLLTSLAMEDGLGGFTVLLSLINYTCIVPFVGGASIFYVQQNLTGQGVTVNDAIHKGVDSFIQLVLASILFWVILVPALICLVIPGIYLSFRLSFIYYAVIIENRKALDALRRSWQLTKGFWWQLFWSFLLLFLLFFLFAFILVIVITLLFGEMNYFASQILGSLIGLLVTPITAIYYVFVFMSLVNIATVRKNQEQYA